MSPVRLSSAASTRSRPLPAGLILVVFAVVLVSCQDRFSPATVEHQEELVSYSAASPPPTLTPLFTVPPPQATPSPQTTAAETPSASPDPNQFATPVIILGDEDSQVENILEVKSTSPAPDPLRFTFSTPAPPPASAWRPPLYEIPWAPSPYDHFFFSRPLGADEINYPLWDYRYGGSFFANVIHTGIDIPVRPGTPVLAAGPGKVMWAGYGLYRGVNDPTDPYGLAVSILHDFGYENQKLHTVYAHLSQIEVARGQHVETGELIGYSGSTGHVTGPHLHFEVRMGDNDFFTTRNPELWLVPPQGWGVLVGRIANSGGVVLVTEQTVIVKSKTSGQNWMAKSYGGLGVNSDPYYRENLVLSDLPAGEYELRLPYQGYEYKRNIEIKPGQVTYFTFQGYKGFNFDLPEAPYEFTPPP